MPAAFAPVTLWPLDAPANVPVGAGDAGAAAVLATVTDTFEVWPAAADVAVALTTLGALTALGALAAEAAAVVAGPATAAPAALPEVAAEAVLALVLGEGADGAA